MTLIVLVHGFCKDKQDMVFLADQLKSHGYQIFSANLPTTYGSLADCVKQLDRQLDGQLAAYQRVYFIAHSMGGLILRAYLSQFPLKNKTACIFIATPYRGSRLAQISRLLPFYAKVFKPVYDLVPAATDQLPHLPKTTPLALIVGNANTLSLGRLFLNQQSDGRVELAATYAPQSVEHIVLPYNHHQIHHHPHTLEHVLRLVKGWDDDFS